MFDVLVYLFENYYQAEGYPDQDTLSRKLHAAGFENEDIGDIRRNHIHRSLLSFSTISRYSR